MSVETAEDRPRATGPRRRGLRVALVGADGAGKSTVTAKLETGALARPVKRIYMGVNLEASSLMLPTTRLLLAAKRRRGRAPDLVASRLAPDQRRPPSRHGRLRRDARDLTRMSVWMLEEWLRLAVATSYRVRGYLVVFDRHFFADYYHADVVSADGPAARVHGWMLRNLYPQPDLVICLDAPADVLYARKPEASRDWLDQRRRQYLALESVVPAFVVIDADRPPDVVFDDVVHAICTHERGTPS